MTKWKIGVFLAALTALTPHLARGGFEKIIGGEPVDAADSIALATVALLNGGSLCTASLLADDLALTAAHCVEGAASGSTWLVFGPWVKTGERREVVGVIWHASFNPGSSERDWSDIALVRFAGGLPSGFQRAKLLSSTSGIEAGDWSELAGYGITDGVLHTGSGALRKTWVQVAEPRFGETEIVFDQRNGSGACHGDSGGPAFVFRGSKAYVVALTSRGYLDPNDDCGDFAIYTRVAPYRSWIRKAAKALGSSARI